MNKNIGRGKRNCCIIGCGNSDIQLLKWLNSHSCSKSSIGECDCESPFKQFPFPGEKTDPELRHLWTRLVNGKNANNNSKVWQPNRNSRVCSSHFVDNQPTPANPNPSLNVGYQNANIPVSRKRPAERNPIPVLPKAKKPQPNDDQGTTIKVVMEPEQAAMPHTESPKAATNMGIQVGQQAKPNAKDALPTSCKNCKSNMSMIKC